MEKTKNEFSVFSVPSVAKTIKKRKIMSKENELLASVSDISTESEFFSPIPDGYKKGKTRYLFVMGTVMSGLGKGIFSSCMAKLITGQRT